MGDQRAWGALNPWDLGIAPPGTAVSGERLTVGPPSTLGADELEMIHFVLRSVQLHRQTS